MDKPFCFEGTCVGCKSAGDCKNNTPICSAQKTCVSCVGVDPTKSCAASHPENPVCATSGAMMGACVKCASGDDCKDAHAPICSSNVCLSCADAGGDKVCMAPGKKLCAMTGSQAGMCVECNASKDCDAASTKPFCSATGVCVGCAQAVAPDTCGKLVSGKPVCSSAGACVQCVANADCANKTAPVCSSGNTCGPCAGDTDCRGRSGPVVCLSKDGHCAAEDETIYVQAAGAACSDLSGAMGGTATVPYCSLGPVPGVISPSRNLVVVRGAVNSASASFGAGSSQLWIVGQTSAVIGGVNTGIRLATGEATIRDIAVSSTLAIGIEADQGATLHLQHVTVSKNSGGGILLAGAAFDIQNTIVTENGPGMDAMGTIWGGVRIKDPPTAGPKQLQYVTIDSNKQVGLSCSAMIQGTGVLVSGSVGGVDITTSCGLPSCGSPGPTCGAQ